MYITWTTRGKQEEMNAAYLAGFIDADGCISVNYRRNVRRVRGKMLTNRSVFFNVSVIVVQKERKVIDAIFDKFGGTLNITKRGIHRYNRWYISGKAVIPFLRLIKPYLIEKKEQATIALEAALHQAECGRGRYRAGCVGTQPLSKADLQYRESVWLRMKELNTCHKFHAAAETKSSEPSAMGVCDSPSLVVISGGAANNAPMLKVA